MKIYENGIIREMTAEELHEIEKANRLFKIEEAARPLSTEEVSAMLITQQINTLKVDDNTALRMKTFYPAWEAGVDYTVDYKVRYGDKLWKCISAHTSIVTWEPSIATASMWTVINETHEGTIDDPIPYDGNMALESGKYYIQNREIYMCNRDTGNPVYNALFELVGIYVEEV